MPSTWLTVTTPVPPMPVRQTANCCCGTMATGSGSTTPSGKGSRRGAFRRCATAGDSTVTKDGQSPFRQDRSWLQDDWWISVLRPNSVATGCTLRQLLCTPQSPQPSQTRWLMKADRGL